METEPMECSGCGWRVPGDDLAADDAAVILQEHAERTCAKPPYDPPYSA